MCSNKLSGYVDFSSFVLSSWKFFFFGEIKFLKVETRQLLQIQMVTIFKKAIFDQISPWTKSDFVVLLNALKSYKPISLSVPSLNFLLSPKKEKEKENVTQSDLRK